MGFRFDKINMLVVEDTQPMQRLLVSVLEALGIKNIETATNGDDAYRAFIQRNHDIILSDWAMEPMDGIELTRKIRQSKISANRLVPVILITGYSAWSRVEEARDAGVTEFLVKPFTANDIARRITHVINHPRDFIETQDFFGPDRRRRRDTQEITYKGPLRRGSDNTRDNALGIFDLGFRA